MVWICAVGVLFALLGLTHAIPQPNFLLIDDNLGGSALRDFLNNEAADTSDIQEIQEIRKRDLEFNQYVPAYRLRGEPTCDQLRTMWLLGKREARRATSTNNLPRTRPYSYGRLIAFAPNSIGRPYFYGEARNFPGKMQVLSPVKGAFNRLRGMLGPGAGRPGSFQRVRAKVATQRKPDESPKGKYGELRGMVLDSHKNSPEEVIAGNPSLMSSDVYQPVRRTPPGPPRQMHAPLEDGFVGPLMAGNPITRSLISRWRPRMWNSREKSCLQVEGSACLIDSECVCAGQYRCSKERCKVFPVTPEIEDSLGIWFSGALPSKELGITSRGKNLNWNQ